MRGFTLVELLIVIAILVIASGLALPFIQSFQATADLATHADTLTSTLRRARWQAVTGQNAASWGVYFDSGNNRFVLFQGTSYAGRDQSFDQEFTYPVVFTLTTDFGNEIGFSRYAGDASASGTVLFSDGVNQASVSIDPYGRVQTIQ